MPDDVTLIVPQREEGTGFTHGTIATTTRNLPDVAVVAMPVWQIIVIRTLKAYVNALLAFVVASAAGAGGDLGFAATHNLFLHAAELAFYPGALAALTNIGMLLTQWDAKVPSSWHA